MKKIFFILATGFTSMIALSTGIYAQNAEKTIASNDVNAKNFMPSIRKLDTLENPAYLENHVPNTNYVNIRAIRDFQDRFNKAENAMWFSDKNGFTSYFKEEGFNDKVCYGRNGNWEYSIIYHTESNLPKNIRASVKSVYYDMTINLVEEVQTKDAKVYIIQLEDKTAIRFVKVNDEGEMETIQEITK